MTVKQNVCGAELLRPEDVAQRLGVSKRQVYFLIDAGVLSKPLKVGRLNRWAESDISDYIARLAAQREAHLINAT